MQSSQPGQKCTSLPELNSKFELAELQHELICIIINMLAKNANYLAWPKSLW